MDRPGTLSFVVDQVSEEHQISVDVYDADKQRIDGTNARNVGANVRSTAELRHGGSYFLVVSPWVGFPTNEGDLPQWVTKPYRITATLE